MGIQTRFANTAVAVGLLLTTASLRAAEGITPDPQTGNYMITYSGDDGTTKQVVFVPNTKIAPIVKSKLHTTEANRISYRYKISNAKTGGQAISGVLFLATHADKATQAVPHGWRGDISPDFDSANLRVSWRFRRQSADDGLQPGASEARFGMVSDHLPGVGLVRLRGSAPTLAFSDEGPSGSIRDQLDALMHPDKNSITRLAAVPRISVPNPYDAAAVLVGIQQHIKTDMASMQLIDPALLGLIDRGLTQAIAAVQGGNTPSLLHEIKSLRQLLKQEHVDVDQDNDGDDDDKEKKPKPRIAKLAAKVLDFDLKYVQKRVKGDKD